MTAAEYASARQSGELAAAWLLAVLIAKSDIARSRRRWQRLTATPIKPSDHKHRRNA